MDTSGVFDLKGRKALVTGGASGLGKRMGWTLARAGADVVLLDANAAGLEIAAAELAPFGGKVFSAPFDVTIPALVHQTIQQAASDLGGLDIAVNAAGIADGRPHDTSPVDIWRRVLDVDLNGVFYCCLEESAVMLPQRHGSIINMASMSGTIVNRFPKGTVPESRQMSLPAYCTAKAGVRQLTRALAALWAENNVRVNCISPGYMQTPMTQDIFENPRVIGPIERDTPLGRVGRPGDLDALILYLASDASSFMTGSELLIDGGYTLW